MSKNKLIVIVFAVVSMIPNYSYALMAHSVLEHYDYSELFLLRTSQPKTGLRAACFGTPDNKFIWVVVGTDGGIGNQFGAIKKIEEDFVVVEQLMMVNGGEWISFEFEWPLANADKSLVDRCGSPPPELIK